MVTYIFPLDSQVPTVISNERIKLDAVVYVISNIYVLSLAQSFSNGLIYSITLFCSLQL